MSTTEIVILGLALSMDAFAVTISNGLAYRGTNPLRRFLMPVFFGLFQGVMPVFGFLLGSLVNEWVEQYAGLITFIILGFIGGKMIWDVFHDKSGEQKGEISNAQLTMPVLFFQAIATSIDALAVGVSFAMLSINIGMAASIIGLTTFLCCIVALFIQKGMGRLLGDKAAIVGGLVLIAIGLKSLFL